MNRRGFTLMEMLLAMTLFSGILVVTYNAIFHAGMVRGVVTERAEALRAAGAFFNRLERELAAVYAYSIRQGGKGGNQLPAEVVFEGVNHDAVVPRDGLVFTCNCGEVWAFAMEDANTTPHMEVAYDFIYDGEEEMTLLFRRQDPTLDADPRAGGYVDPLWRYIRGVNFRYLDPVDKGWRDQWDAAAAPSSPLPQAVEVTVWLAEPRENEDEIENPLVLGKTIMLSQVAPVGSGN